METVEPRYKSTLGSTKSTMYQDPEYKTYKHTSYKEMTYEQSRTYDSHAKDRSAQEATWQQCQKLRKTNASGEEYPAQEEGQKQHAESPQGMKQKQGASCLTRAKGSTAENAESSQSRKQEPDAPCLDKGRSSCTRETEQGPRQTTMARGPRSQIKSKTEDKDKKDHL